MTATILERDVDITEDIVLDSSNEEADSCEFARDNEESCDAEAKYILSLKCCGEEVRYCEDHAIYVAKTITAAPAIHHGTCGKTTYSNPKCHVVPIKS